MTKEDEFYKHIIGHKRPSAKQNYDNAYKHSLANKGVARPTKSSLKKKSKEKSIALLLATVSVIATSAWVGISIDDSIEAYNDSLVVAEYFEEEGIRDVLADYSWGYSNKELGRVYGYNQDRLAVHVAKSENPDITLFGLYQTITTNKIGNMDAIVSRLPQGEEEFKYEDFNDYLAKRGFVDKKGNPSEDVYKKTMTERIVAIKNIEKIAENHGVKK